MSWIAVMPRPFLKEIVQLFFCLFRGRLFAETAPWFATSTEAATDRL